MRSILFSLLVTVSFNFVHAQYEPHPSKPACGLTGLLEERIASCGNQQSEGFTLVARTESDKKVYKYNYETYANSKVDILITDIVPGRVDYKNAKKVCSASLPEVVGLVNHKWRLPYIGELEKVKEALVRLSNMAGHYLWTQSPYSLKESYMFFGHDGFIDAQRNVWGSGSVRCVTAIVTKK